jgi:hypothetical protein
MPASGQIRPWCFIGMDGSLPLDSFRAGRMLLTAASGQKLMRRSKKHRVAGIERQAGPTSQDGWEELVAAET